MKNVWIRPLAMAVLALSACKSDRVTGVTSETETGELAGILVFEGGKPAEGAEVILAPADSLSALKKGSALSAEATTTDAKGRYSFKALDSGTYHISASLKQGNDTLVAYRFNIRFKNKLFVGTDTLVDPGKIEVRVLLGGKPAEKVYCYVPGTSYIAISDKDGLCVISGIEPGTYDVAFLHSAYTAEDVKQVKVLPGSRIGLVTLRWGGVPVSDLAGYILYRDTAGAVLHSRLTTGYLVQDTNYQDAVYGDLQDTSARNLQYKIQAQDKNGNASLFAAFPALRVTRPNLPAVPNPANGSTGTSQAPTLGWAPVNGSNVSYAVYLGTESVPDSAVGTGLTAASVKVSGLKKSTRYYWRVTASVGGAKAAGPIWSFTTGTADLPQDTGLVAYWDFNDGSGTKLSDKSGNGNDAAVSGAIWNAAGIDAGALSFDGDGDYCTVPNTNNRFVFNKFTVSAWVNVPAAPDSTRRVITLSDGRNTDTDRTFEIRLERDNKLSVELFTSSNGRTFVISNKSFQLNRWTLIAVTAGDGQLKLYTNGSLDTTVDYSGPIRPSTQPLMIGRNAHPTIHDYQFSGRMDEIRLSNGVRSASEVAAEWNRLKPGGGPENNLIPIQGGSFTDDSGKTATVSGFSIQETEVTLGQFRKWAPTKNNVEGANHTQDAVNEVTWVQALQYANWLSKQEGLDTSYVLDATKTVSDRNWGDKSYWSCDFTKNGYRLPTGDEWEYAAKSGLNRAHATDDGTVSPGKANLPKSSAGHIVNVKSYPASPWGLYDMTGNLWEWVWDDTQGVWGDPKPKAANRVDFRALPDDVNRNYNVKRGGGYIGNDNPARTTEAIYAYDNGYHKKDHGFRLLRKP